MSKKRADRPTGGRRDDDNEKQQPNKSARLEEQTAASSTVGSSLAAAASSVSALLALSPAQRLYHDALISVFGFLDLGAVIIAHASCRSWRDAAHKEPSRKITLRCQPSRLDWFGASPLRHHVGEYCSVHLRCTLQQIASLRAFPSLTRVTIRVDLAFLTPLAAQQGQAGYAETIAATVAQWPSRLTYLNMWVADYRNGKGGTRMQVLIDCIGQLDALTELDLRLPRLPQGSLTLQPLLQLTHLQSLNLNGGYSPGAAECLVLKQMSSLTHLNLESSSTSPESLQVLCTPPHQLAALQQIGLSVLATAAHMEALICLPALSALDLGVMELAAVPYLPRFPHLRTLRLQLQEPAVLAAMPSLTQCTQLTALDFQFCRFTLADLTELTRSLTALTSLQFRLVRFDGLDQPSALSCLRSLPQLRELHFFDCSGVRLVHWTNAAFTSLSSLRSLSVDVPAASLAEARSLFTVPCTLMPQLTDTYIKSTFIVQENADLDDD